MCCKCASVATHGLGGLSAAIAIKELKMLGAKLAVRLWTCGGLTSQVSVGDVVVALGAPYQQRKENES